jgi:hypothetical protein
MGEKISQSGTDVMIFKRKYWRFIAQNTASFWKKLS